MRRRERIAEPTARARSGHAACDAAFPIPRRPRHASRPALRFPWCGRWFRDQRAVGAGLRIDRPRPVGGGAARPDASWSSDVGSAHCASKVVASLRMCSPASRAPVAGSLRGSRGCPEPMRIETPLFSTPPAHPSFRQQSRQWAVAALMVVGHVAHHGGRCDRDRPRPPIVTILAGHSGPPLHRPLRGLGGAAVVRRAHDAPRGIERSFRDRCTPNAPGGCGRWPHARKVPRRRQATGRAKRRCAPRIAGFPFGTSDGVGPPMGWPSARVDRPRLVGVASLLPFWRKEACNATHPPPGRSE